MSFFLKLALMDRSQELAAIQSAALLPEDCRTARGHAHQQRNDHHERQQRHAQSLGLQPAVNCPLELVTLSHSPLASMESTLKQYVVLAFSLSRRTRKPVDARSVVNLLGA